MSGRWSMLAAVCALLPAALAQADTFWKPAKHSSSPKERERAIKEGNDHLADARHTAVANNGAHTRQMADEARLAIASYEHAIELGPDDADLHYRAVIAAGYIDEQRGAGAGLCAACRDGFEAIVRHVDGLRKADPRDPRDIEVSWEMSIALSKLGGLGGPEADHYFERAVAEYDHWRKIADEANPDRADTMSTSYSNDAELLMALGRLEESIAHYRMGTELNPNEPLGYYGLAVAYDRDGQWEKAKSAMAEALARDPQIKRLTAPSVFFVPDGDLSYYLGLAHEVRGDVQAAIAEFGRFLSHSPNNHYTERAKQHLEELKKGEIH